jgi:hypothetical protein
MRSILFLILFFLIGNAQAVIHKRTEYFLDIELSKKQFLFDCSGGLENDNSIIGFHLLDGDTYYFAYYRRVWPMKECKQLQTDYLGLLKNSATVRLVIDHPKEGDMDKNSREECLAPFIRLQAGDKCKAYFSKDCDLPENYWVGVTPEKKYLKLTRCQHSNDLNMLIFCSIYDSIALNNHLS